MAAGVTAPGTTSRRDPREQRLCTVPTLHPAALTLPGLPKSSLQEPRASRAWLG